VTYGRASSSLAFGTINKNKGLAQHCVNPFCFFRRKNGGILSYFSNFSSASKKCVSWNALINKGIIYQTQLSFRIVLLS